MNSPMAGRPTTVLCITAFPARACIDHERAIRFTHWHNDMVNWQTVLGAPGLA